jgi:hypothetical protein
LFGPEEGRHVIIATKLCAQAIAALPSNWMTGLGAFVLLYIGPDQILPLTSVLGAITGLLLMFWNRVMGLLRTVTRALSRRGPHKSPGQET